MDIADYSWFEVYDQPTHPSYYRYGLKYLYLYRQWSLDGDFDINMSPHVSTGNGLTLIYDYHSYDLATSGFHISVCLKGKLSSFFRCRMSIIISHVSHKKKSVHAKTLYLD